jgi:hypothetical protein
VSYSVFQRSTYCLPNGFLAEYFAFHYIFIILKHVTDCNKIVFFSGTNLLYELPALSDLINSGFCLIDKMGPLQNWVPVSADRPWVC